MQQVKKVVLAYSGGVDTSVCIPYLKNEYGISEVVTFVADLGQGEDLELIRQKALNSGASQSIVGNLVNRFVERYAFPAIRASLLIFHCLAGVIIFKSGPKALIAKSNLT